MHGASVLHFSSRVSIRRFSLQRIRIKNCRTVCFLEHTQQLAHTGFATHRRHTSERILEEHEQYLAAARELATPVSPDTNRFEVACLLALDRCLVSPVPVAARLAHR